jgi:hypothetical protein
MGGGRKQKTGFRRIVRFEPRMGIELGFRNARITSSYGGKVDSNLSLPRRPEAIHLSLHPVSNPGALTGHAHDRSKSQAKISRLQRRIVQGSQRCNPSGAGVVPGTGFHGARFIAGNCELGGSRYSRCSLSQMECLNRERRRDTCPHHSPMHHRGAPLSPKLPDREDR